MSLFDNSLDRMIPGGYVTKDKFACLGLGVIEYQTSIDKYQNPVSIIRLPDNTTYRMVHHTTKYSYMYATIYDTSQHNKFMRFKYKAGKNDMQENTVTLANYYVGWGDGDNGGATIDPLGPDIKEILGSIQEDGDELVYFILNVLLHCGQVPAVWQMKDEDGATVPYIKK